MCCFAVNDVIHGSSRDIFCELNDLHSLEVGFFSNAFNWDGVMRGIILVEVGGLVKEQRREKLL